MPTATPLRPTDLDRLRAEHPDLRIVDVRTPGEFAGRHIPGSYNVPLPQLGEHRAELTATTTGPVVLVCESGRRAEQAEQQLADAGLARVHVLDGGVAAWEARGLDVVRPEGPAPWSLDRQVRLVAGAIVAVSVAASVVWPPARYVAGVMGAGLAVAALTDTCAMGMALAKLPYNTRQRATCDLPAVVSQITAPSEVRS
jgi:rhodanese-related sulfurtransferase